MTQISEPEVTVSIINANVISQNDAQKLLFVGQKTSAGTATSGELIQNILNDGAEDTLFGEDSMLAAMIRSARKLNKIVQFDAIPLDDNGASAPSIGDFEITGSPEEAGTITFSIGSLLNNSYTVSVSASDTPVIIAVALVTLILDDPTCPVEAGNTVGTVIMTAVNEGSYGDGLGLAVDINVPGISVGLVGMAGGGADPVVTNVFDVVGNNRYQGVVWPYTDVSVLTTFLDERFNVDDDVLDGAGFVSVTDLLSNHLTRLLPLNSENLVEICDKFENTATLVGPSMLEIPVVKAAQLASIRSLRLTPDASIANFVISANGALDAFGGPALASKPYANTPFTNLPLIPVNLGFTDTLEVKQIQEFGGAVLGNNTARTSVIIGRVPTTYKTDAAGNADLTFAFLNYRDTASGIREYFFNNLKSRFGQSRLTEGNAIPGRDQVNANTVRAFIERLYLDLSGVNFVLVQNGDTAIQYFKDNLSVTLVLSTGSVTIQAKTPIITQLRRIIFPMQISFSTGG
jgi:phage tail sheath gpL-like